MMHFQVPLSLSSLFLALTLPFSYFPPPLSFIGQHVNWNIICKRKVFKISITHVNESKDFFK